MIFRSFRSGDMGNKRLGWTVKHYINVLINIVIYIIMSYEYTYLSTLFFTSNKNPQSPNFPSRSSFSR